MSAKNFIEFILSGDSSKLTNALGKGERSVKSFGAKVKNEFDAIKRAAGSLQGKLAGLGVSIGAAMLVKQSAQLDKGLTQIGQTAGETREKVTGLRKELFDMAKETGEKVDDLKQGFNNAVQAGLNFKEALPVLKATNKAMAVTGANADVLTSGLTVAAAAFEFNLAKPGLALTLLDKMVVAGRLGNAELQNLSSIFSRIGVNAQTAGMGFEQTLAFIEGLSLVERQPERLATLADSTLRLFTNVNYMKQAQKATGIKFFDDKGEQRSPLKILDDIYKKYDALSTKKAKLLFLGEALKGVDLDTFKGTRTFMKGEMLSKVNDFVGKITQAGGTIDRDMDEAMNNAVSQAGRLGAEMRRAADDFIQPLNAGLTSAIKKLLNTKKEGGLGLSGEQMAIGGAAALAGGYLAYRGGGAIAKKLIGRLGGTAAGVAEGKALEAATGVAPVFITNWPATIGGMGGGVPVPGKGGNALVAGAKGTASFAGGYAVGAGINWLISKRVEQFSQGRNNSIGDYLYDWVHTDIPALFSKIKDIKNDIAMNITVDQSGRVTTDTNNMNTTIKVNAMPRGKL